MDLGVRLNKLERNEERNGQKEEAHENEKEVAEGYVGKEEREIE